ncbi:MAG: hypothetical protein RR425_04125 [Erysipelotrichales bacterium]
MIKKIECDKINNLKIFDWNKYFKDNKNQLLHLDYNIQNELSNDEISLITPSIQAFQIGERSEGKHFLNKVNKYVDRTNDKVYLDNIKMFIAEENRHSQSLLNYMNLYSIPNIQKSFLDNVFRGIRKMFTLEFEIITLVTAEMIALSYYDALCKASNSKLLKSICQQMLYDESYHVVFQSQMLYKLSKDRNSILNIFIVIIRKVLLRVTCLAVYFKFKNIFRGTGYSYKKLRKRSIGYLKQSLEITKNNIY